MHQNPILKTHTWSGKRNAKIGSQDKASYFPIIPHWNFLCSYTRWLGVRYWFKRHVTNVSGKMLLRIDFCLHNFKNIRVKMKEFWIRNQTTVWRRLAFPYWTNAYLFIILGWVGASQNYLALRFTSMNSSPLLFGEVWVWCLLCFQLPLGLCVLDKNLSSFS